MSEEKLPISFVNNLDSRLSRFGGVIKKNRVNGPLSVKVYHVNGLRFRLLFDNRDNTGFVKVGKLGRENYMRNIKDMSP